MTSERLNARLSVCFTPDQMRKMREIVREQARQGKESTLSDVVRAAVDHYSGTLSSAPSADRIDQLYQMVLQLVERSGAGE